MKNPFNNMPAWTFTSRREFVQKYQERDSTKEAAVLEVVFFVSILFLIGTFILPVFGLFVLALYLCRK
jgi:hypothetical protein